MIMILYVKWSGKNQGGLSKIAILLQKKKQPKSVQFREGKRQSTEKQIQSLSFIRKPWS